MPDPSHPSTAMQLALQRLAEEAAADAKDQAEEARRLGVKADQQYEIDPTDVRQPESEHHREAMAMRGREEEPDASDVAADYVARQAAPMAGEEREERAERTAPDAMRRVDAEPRASMSTPPPFDSARDDARRRALARMADE